jgi:AcrR family transcriptional regulator
MSNHDDRAPGRPRRPETDDAIVRAALELIREAGPEAVNVAAIASRAGLARTTIYRRYRNREELLRVALEHVTARGEPPTHADVGDKVDWVLARTEEVLDHGIGLGGVASVLVGDDPAFGAELRRALEEALRPVKDQIDVDRQQGRLAEHVDADALVTLLLGSYLAETLLRGTPTDDRWREKVTDLLRPLVVGP